MSRAESLQKLFDLKVKSLITREWWANASLTEKCYTQDDLEALLHEVVDATMQIYTDFAGQRTKLTFDQLREELFAHVKRDNNG